MTQSAKYQTIPTKKLITDKHILVMLPQEQWILHSSHILTNSNIICQWHI